MWVGLMAFVCGCVSLLLKNGHSTPIRIDVSIPNDCGVPHLMTRVWGTEAAFADAHGHLHPVLPTGNYMVDVALVACNGMALNTTACAVTPRSVACKHVHLLGTNLSHRQVTGRWRQKTKERHACATRYQLPSTKQTRPSPLAQYTYERPAIQKERLPVCFVGASFARRMADAGRQLGLVTEHIDAKYVRDLKLADKRLQPCGLILIHTLQWDLGWPENRITRPEVLEAHIATGLTAFKSLRRQVVVLSSSYNPPGKAMLACPPKDWRRPDYIDAYNSVLQRQAHAHGLVYVDNNVVIGGLAWDTAPDWCHFDNEVMEDIVSHTLARVQTGPLPKTLTVKMGRVHNNIYTLPPKTVQAKIANTI